MNDEYFMKKALDLAKQALLHGEFPVGCILVFEDKIVAAGRRTHSTGQNPNEIDHAEIHALREFSTIQTKMDPEKITLYCTLEPCLMCFGAILISGIGKIVYAFEDAMGGGTQCQLSSLPSFYKIRQPKISSHVLRNESLKLFADFFNNPNNPYWKESKLAKYTLEQHRISSS